MSMKLLVLAILATVITAPAFAQQAANAQYRVAAYVGNSNAYPDRQLAGQRWKTNSKPKRSLHHGSVSHK
jgi:hypothetical protein